MRVIITAGGTGGHIYPALAILDKIKEKEPDSEFLYIGTTNRMEKDIVPKRGIKYVGIEMYGFTKSLAMDLKLPILILKNIKKCQKIIRDFKPDVVLGIGGYVTYPVIKAAKKEGIKVFIHEQNSIPGKSNKALAKLADKIGISFPGSKEFFDERKVVFTGNPCSEQAIDSKPIPKTNFGLDPKKKLVLIVQGSLGSSSINEKMTPFLKNVDDDRYEILYVTGKASYEDFIKNDFSKNVHVVSYIDNLSGLMKNADVVISRAGASSISEIIALKKLSILIPSPYVANNHQFFNALELANNKAAFMIEEKNLNEKTLKDILNKLIDKEYLELQINMQLKLSKMGKNDSSTIIYNTIKDMIK